MEIQILGAHQAETNRYRFLSILVDGTFAVDAGSLTSTLSWEEQERLRHLIITHAHYDHVKDLNILAFNHLERNLRVYCLPEVEQAIRRHLFSQEVWMDLTARPSAQQPAVTFYPVEPYRAFQIEGYEVTAFPSIHTVPTAGYRVSRGGRSFFYTSDTGPGNLEEWQRASSDLLITEVTFSNRMDQAATQTSHLTPNLLRKELVRLGEALGRLPRLLIVHINPMHEAEIARELAEVARELGADITLAREGMRLAV
jgi:ribonuclease BN (tRNA processing enzyme)